MFVCDRPVTVAEHAESHRGWILPRTLSFTATEEFVVLCLYLSLCE